MKTPSSPLLGGLIAALFALAHPAGAETAETPGQELDPKQRSIVAIAAFTARGDIPELKEALAEGLDTGLSVSEIREVLVQMYAYAGFPRSLNGIAAFMEVLDERRARGIEDQPGREATPLPPEVDREQLGEAVRNRLWAVEVAPPAAGYQLFAPEIDRFLKEHLFADIISRDNLDIRSRELATVSALAGLKGVDAQLASHLNAALNVGVSAGQLRQALELLAGKLAPETGSSAGLILERVLGSRKPVQEITRSGSQPPVKGSPEIFTGEVTVQPLFGEKDAAKFTGAYVTFQPGARSFWHIHPTGQHLLVVSGVGRTGVWGGTVEEIRSGDVVWCPPGVKHWHGASPHEAMTHLALTGTVDGVNVEWLEEVTPEQYGQ